MENENRTRSSFLKGALAGFFLAAIIAVMGISIFMLVHAQVEQRISQKNNPETAKEVVANAAVQKKMEKIAELIDENYYEDIDPEEIENYIYKGLLAGTTDPYSTYYSEEELKQFMEEASGSYSGIGVTMQYDPARGMAKIVSVNAKGPASEANIKAGDYIYKVDGEMIEIQDADTTALVSHIRGEEGTTVELTLLRGDNNKEVVVEVERRNVEVETVTSQMLEDKIGYIKISQFEGVTAEQFDEHYEKLQEEGAKGLILDLRANPGGQVDIVCSIAQHFLPKGLVTYMEDKKGRRQEYPCNGKDIWDKPLTVLIDGNSASASEILAGAIRDYEVGTLMGTKTFGKGIVQQTVNLGDNTALKITFAKYYTPNGENIHGKGIEPDIEVPYEALEDDEEYTVEKDNQIQEAVSNIKKQIAE